MLLVTFVALSLLANLRTMLKRKLPAHENIRAVDCDIMDFNEEYTLSDYYTISEMLTELKEALQKPSLILRPENFCLLHKLNFCANDCSGYF